MAPIYLARLFFNLPVAAYIDPATTSYIIQIFAGLFISLLVAFSAFSARIKSAFINLRIYWLRRKVAREAARQRRKNPALARQALAAELPAAALPSRRQFLFSDQRSLKERIIHAAVIAFALVFTLFIFGPLDLFISNHLIFAFALSSIWLRLVLAALLVFLGLLALLLLSKGRFFDLVLSFLAGILLAGYLQGNFLNLQLGQLTGDAIAWQKYTGHALLNLLIWAGLIMLPLVLRLLSARLWRGGTIFLAAIVVFMQLSGLVYSLATTDLSQDKQDGYISRSGIYSMSAEENVIILILDRLDEKFIDNMVSKEPDFYAGLDGFTRFTNNLSAYCRTYPSAVHMLTGRLSKYEQPAGEFFLSAWQEATFLPDLQKAGFTSKLYMTSPYMYTDVEQVKGIAANVEDGEIKLDYPDLVGKFWRLSTFRYAPHALKANFYLATNDFAALTGGAGQAEPYYTDDAKFMAELKQEGLRLDQPGKNFIYYHLNGMHDYILTEEAELLPEGENGSQLKQMRACFAIVDELLGQMKELGIYEDATIIITGDHGQSWDFYNLDAPVRTALFVKPKGSHTTPLKVSKAPVSQDLLRATIIEQAGLDPSGYGDTYFSVPEDAAVERHYYYRVDDYDAKRHYVEEFLVRGDAADFSNWEKLGEFDIKHLHG